MLCTNPTRQRRPGSRDRAEALWRHEGPRAAPDEAKGEWTIGRTLYGGFPFLVILGLWEDVRIRCLFERSWLE